MARPAPGRKAENAETHAGSGPLAPGEYNCVVRASCDPERLLLVHATPLTRTEARVLAAEITRAFDVPSHRLIFSKRNGGFRHKYVRRLVPWFTRADGSVRKQRQVVRDELGRAQLEYVISLPPKPRIPACAAAGQTLYAGIRAGVVLHEYAHLLDYVQRNRSDHGPQFTAQLDRLAAWWCEHHDENREEAR